MRCEICGKYILEGKRIKVEGSTIVVCDNCTGYGEFVKKEEPYKRRKVSSTSQQSKTKKETPKEEFEIEEEEVLVENFEQVVRREREKKGMKQDDLGKRINEPASLIHRLESGKFKPSPELIKKIERALGIKLMITQEKVDFQLSRKKGEEVTLGDLVVIKKGQKGEEE